jgi:hypothetical protein
MAEVTTSTTDVPAPRGYTLTIPDTAAAPLADLPQVLITHVATFLTAAAATLRRHAPAPVDACMNRGTCHPDQLPIPRTGVAPTGQCCLLCALDHAFNRRVPAGASHHYVADLRQAVTVARQLALDTIEANPTHGGEVFVLTHLADLVRTNTPTGETL